VVGVVVVVSAGPSGMKQQKLQANSLPSPTAQFRNSWNFTSIRSETRIARTQVKTYVPVSCERGQLSLGHAQFSCRCLR